MKAAMAFLWEMEGAVLMSYRTGQITWKQSVAASREIDRLFREATR